LWQPKLESAPVDAQPDAACTGYSLDADLFHRTFWTLSAWWDRESLDRFAGTNPHRDVVTATKPVMEPSKFVFWTCPPSDVPVSWHEARARLQDSRPN
jgi:hypothetical protein